MSPAIFRPAASKAAAIPNLQAARRESLAGTDSSSGIAKLFSRARLLQAEVFFLLRFLHHAPDVCQKFGRVVNDTVFDRVPHSSDPRHFVFLIQLDRTSAVKRRDV